MGILKHTKYRITKSMSSCFQSLLDLLEKLCLLLPVILTSMLFAQPLSGITEYQVKAAYLFNFTRFVEWPDSCFSDSTSPIVIGIMGEDPFREDLDNTVRNKLVQKRPLEIKRVRWGPEIKSCHILFICESEEKRFKLILNQIKNFPILTVGDVPGFLEKGGIINFYIEESRVRFEIDIKASETAKLPISSLLLKLARIRR